MCVCGWKRGEAAAALSAACQSVYECVDGVYFSLAVSGRSSIAGDVEWRERGGEREREEGGRTPALLCLQ